MPAELILPNGQVKEIGVPAGELEHTDEAAVQAELAGHLVATGGLPFLRISVDPDGDTAAITSVGLDADIVPTLLLHLALQLNGLDPAEFLTTVPQEVSA